MQTTLQLGLIWESVQTDGKLTELIQDLLDTSTWEIRSRDKRIDAQAYRLYQRHPALVTQRTYTE